jgi:AcrR family transcriptional regulator
VCGQLRSAALSIVGADGIESLTMRRIAGQAGVPEDEAERHYRTAEDCLHQTYEEVSAGVLDDFRSAFRAEPGWRRALTLGGRTLLERMAARPEEARLCFIEVLRGDHELMRRRVASRRRMVQLFSSELRARMDDGDEVSELQLELLIGAAFQAISAAVTAGDIADLPELESELVWRAEVFEPVPA